MKKIIAVVLSVLVLVSFALMAMGSSGTDSEPKVNAGETNAVETEAPVEGTPTVKVGEVLELSDMNITYVECIDYKGYNEFLPPAEGNMIYRLEIKADNTSDIDQYISSLNFNCYADNSATEIYLGDEILSATISPGRSAKGYLYFEVPTDAENVEVEYEYDILSGDKAIFVVK